MNELPFLANLAGDLPLPYDSSRTTVGYERWTEQSASLGDEADRDFAEGLARDELGRKLLDALFGNSPFLTHCVLHEIAFLRDILQTGPDAALGSVYRHLDDAIARDGSESVLMRGLRQGKRRIALLAALADMARQWPLEKVTKTLSDYAAGALDRSLAHLLRAAESRGELSLTQPDDPVRGSGVVILGMGKLGAFELNYSSDIDIIVLYDESRVDYRGSKHVQDCLVKITRTLVKFMQERTADGYVFRTDLRLRPDPSATPVALSQTAAVNYYESLGQNWERAAMIKARPVAGDLDAGHAFLQEIAPFIWRKYLDFASIEDIKSIKRQIHAHKGHASIKLAGHNIKLGRGGIREIEFFAQTQQLIAGGRDPRLRLAGTCDAIRALVETDRLEERVADDLIACYGFLRDVEHRLQMINDEQTQTLPADKEGFAHLACFLGFGDADQFSEGLYDTLVTVQRHYDALFESARALGAEAGRLIFTGSEDDPGTLETLQQLGFSDPAAISATVRKWHHGRYRATTSRRARQLLTDMMPDLLKTLAGTAHPNMAFYRFDEFLGKLPAGIQLFSLFGAHPALLDLLASILGTAPQLAEQLTRNPMLLDGVLSPDFFAPLPGEKTLAEDLALMLGTARDFQDVLDVTRRWANDRKFQIGVQMLRASPDKGGTANEAGPALSSIADVLLRALLPKVEEEFALHHGRIEGSGFAVLAMGRLGGREIAPGSDLDLIFIYDHREGAETSTGPKPLPLTQYYARLGQRFISAITAQTGEGRLYEVDMRLRPSGKAGPIAVTIEAYDKYQRDEAWTWEHMALTRARPIAGPQALQASIADIIARTLCVPREAGKLAFDVHDMRRRIARERGDEENCWNIKDMRGGLLDIEFICQYLQLKHAAESPDVLRRNTTDCLQALRESGHLNEEDAGRLVEAAILYRNLQGLLRLCIKGAFNEEDAPQGLLISLARTAGEADFAALKERLEETRDTVTGIYQRLVSDPAAVYQEATGPGLQKE